MATESGGLILIIIVKIFLRNESKYLKFFVKKI